MPEGVEHLIWNILLALGISAALISLLGWVRSIFITPVHKDPATALTVQLTVSGTAPALEQTADGVLWLIRSGRLPARLVLVDNGMDEETRAVALRLEGRGVELK